MCFQNGVLQVLPICYIFESWLYQVYSGNSSQNEVLEMLVTCFMFVSMLFQVCSDSNSNLPVVTTDNAVVGSATQPQTKPKNPTRRTTAYLPVAKEKQKCWVRLAKFCKGNTSICNPTRKLRNRKSKQPRKQQHQNNQNTHGVLYSAGGAEDYPC